MASSGRAMAHLLVPRLLAPLRASCSTSSRSAWTHSTHPVRQAHTDRYTTIHAFFTRHGRAATVARPPPSIPRHFPPTSRRWNTNASNPPKPQKNSVEGGTVPPAKQPASSASSPTSTSTTQPPACPRCQVTPPVIPKTQLPSASQAHPVHISEYSPFIRRLINRSSELSHNLPHRLTKEDLLNAAESWWQRLRIRLKWFFIRGWRRFNTDDLSAFFSWFVVGNSEFHLPCAIGAYPLTFSFMGHPGYHHFRVSGFRHSQLSPAARARCPLDLGLSYGGDWRDGHVSARLRVVTDRQLRVCHRTEVGCLKDHVPQCLRFASTSGPSERPEVAQDPKGRQVDTA